MSTEGSEEGDGNTFNKKRKKGNNKEKEKQRGKLKDYDNYGNKVEYADDNELDRSTVTEQHYADFDEYGDKVLVDRYNKLVLD